MKHVRPLKIAAACFAAFLCALPGLAAPRQTSSPAPAFAAKYLEQIPLRYADAATVAKTLNSQPLPGGIKRVKVDAQNPQALQVLGTAEGIAQLKTMVLLVDVAPKTATYDVIIERNRFAANGTRYANPVATKTLTLTHNVASRFAVTDDNGETLSVSVTARMPTDKTKPTLLATLGWMNKKKNTVGLEGFMPLPVGKEKVRVIGVTFADETAFIAALGAGKIPREWQGKQIAYILYVKPVAAPK